MSKLFIVLIMFLGFQSYAVEGILKDLKSKSECQV